MWGLAEELFKAHGIYTLVIFGLCVVIVCLYKQGQNRQEQLLTLYRERIKDVTESKERYEELAHKLDQSIDLLIKVFKRNSD
jgi:septation ring formation regulator EzrA